MKKKIKKWKRILITVFVLLNLFLHTVFAAEPGSIVSYQTTEDSVVLYLQDPGEIVDIQYQIGTVSGSSASWNPISELAVPVKTVILIDNSLSVTAEYRPLIAEIINDLVANRMDRELFTIATFSDTHSYLIEDSNNYAELKAAVDGITYTDQETYLTDVLYELITSWTQDTDTVLRRVVMISDGVDENSIGYTKEELYSLMKEYPYPIYTIGCPYKNSDNSEALKNMFALSRTTQAAFWRADEIQNAMDVAGIIGADNQLLRLELKLPPEVLDGTRKGIKLSLNTELGVVEQAIEIKMPFAAPAAVPETAEAETKQQTKAETTEEITVPENVSADPKPELKTIIIFAGLGVLAVMLLVGIIVMAIRLIKERNEIQIEEAPEHAAMESIRQHRVTGGIEETELIGSDSDTQMIWEENNRPYTLILTDLKNSMRRFEYPLTGDVLVGRSKADGSQIVIDYDRSVSRVHCKISINQGQLTVTDLGAKNRIQVNGNIVVGEADLYHGSILTLGNVRLKVELC